MEIFVRPAVASDVTWLFGQLRLFSDFFGAKHELIENEEYVRTTLLGLMENHVLMVAEKGATLVGFVAGVVNPHLFNPNIRWLAEVFWWVVPEQRGSRAGLMLLDAFVKWGEENANWITFSLNEKTPVRDHCLLKRGFVQVERAYLKEVV